MNEHDKFWEYMYIGFKIANQKFLKVILRFTKTSQE